MTVIVTNQQPVVLDPVHTISCTGQYDPVPAIQDTIIDPLSTPLNAAAPVSIADTNGNDITNQIPAMLLACLRDQADPAAEADMKDLLGQTLLHFDRKTELPTGELFAIQAGTALKWPAPAQGVIYTAQADVIPAAKGLLAGPDGGEFFTSLAYAYHPNTLGFWFQSSAAFADFQTWLANQVQLMSTSLPGETTRLLGEFGKLTLKALTESLLLRADDTDGNEEHSFARLLVHMLMLYVQQQNAPAVANTAHQQSSTPAVAGVLPFTMGELFCPRSVVLVNVEAHARATSSKVSAEWQLINTSLASPVKVVSHRKLSRLTALPRQAAKAQALAARQQTKQPAGRSAQVKFRKRPPSKVQLLKSITLVLSRMGKVNKSQNIFRKSRTTFVRANRRNPDDFNKPGRITSMEYMPDLHIYIDTSGSISEENYQQAVLMLIRLAKKLNVNLYFNSFSHILSQEVMLHTENKSVAQIWKEFRRIPKVNGGTEFRQIWDYINTSPVRRRQLSLMVTDFEWGPPPQRVDHPANLFYAPCSSMNWDRIVRSAKDFSAGMKHIDPTIKQKLLGLIV